jgi:hypothetical protein
VRGRPLHAQIVGVGVAVLELEVAADLVEGETLREQILEIEREPAAEAVHAQQTEQARFHPP